MTQEKLSESSGIDRTFISHIEKGGRNISIEKIEKILSGLNVSVKHFFHSNYFK
jgi:transcriptional regulator with XRE-family HTH domain